MTWYQSITSKVNYAGRELGARGGIRGSRHLATRKISTTCICDAERKVVTQRIFDYILD